jgi:hypothetical protein
VSERNFKPLIIKKLCGSRSRAAHRIIPRTGKRPGRQPLRSHHPKCLSLFSPRARARARSGRTEANLRLRLAPGARLRYDLFVVT